MRSWEIIHRIWSRVAPAPHSSSARKPATRAYHQADHPGQDDKNWFCFVNSKYDPKAARDVFKKEYKKLIP
jgi:adenylylsulfate reductase subunit A